MLWLTISKKCEVSNLSPYLLAGIYCGGRVAYEMAQQLHEQGQKVALVALLDTLKDGEAIKIIPIKSGSWRTGITFYGLAPPTC